MKITPIQLNNFLTKSNSKLIIDLRSKNEFTKKAVPTSINIPYDDHYNWELLDKKSEIVLYCENELLSIEIFFKLKNLNFKNVCVLEGGFHNWIATKSCNTQDKYHRQIILPEFGEITQAKLQQTSPLFIGAGAINSTSIMILSAAGVGRIGVIDGDTVAEHNLHRQTLHSHNSLGTNKAISAIHSINALNPDCDTTAYSQFINNENAAEIISCYDLIIDGSDNYETKYLVNNFCRKLGKPFIIASVQKYEGQIFSFTQPHKNAGCFECLFPESPEKSLHMSCQANGILPTTTAMAGTIQSNEVFFSLMNKRPHNKMIRFSTSTYFVSETEIEVRNTCKCQKSQQAHND
jgi:molybdopterin/thiamine biosynthesis adenylyltransferase/rhodanese-related sulfurtransferase